MIVIFLIVMKKRCSGCRGIPFGHFCVVARRKREDTTVEYLERGHKVLLALCTAVPRLNFWQTVILEPHKNQLCLGGYQMGAQQPLPPT